MKKLMLAVAVVGAAIIGQAATVTWNSNATKLVDKDGNVQTGLSSGSIMLVLLSDSTGWSDGTWSAAKGSVTELASASIGTGKAAGKITGSAYKFDYDAADASSSPLKNNDVLAVVFKDADGKYSQLTYNTGAAVTETLTVSGLDQNNWSGSLVFGQATGVSGIIAPVPEPTSAMLVLLGVAGLALKRKRA